MMFKSCVFAALAAAVCAQIPTNVSPEQQSALLALATALPPSVLAEAATNAAGFASEIQSSIAAGKTPEWYQALPTDVKSALASIYPVQTSAQTTPAETATETATPTSSASATEVETTTTVVTSAPQVSAPSGTGASGIGGNGTAITSVNTPTLSGGSPQPTEHTGAASISSAAIGAGIAGAMAFIGMLAL